MPAGRPTKYRKSMCKQAIELGAQGMSKTEIWSHLGISWDTFYRWLKEKPEFSDAIKNATKLSQAWWEAKGRAGTLGEIEGFQGTSYIFQMKNRFRDDWSDTHKQEVSGKDGGPLQITWEK